jgi:hypothetical protein
MNLLSYFSVSGTSRNHQTTYRSSSHGVRNRVPRHEQSSLAIHVENKQTTVCFRPAGRLIVNCSRLRCGRCCFGCCSSNCSLNGRTSVDTQYMTAAIGTESIIGSWRRLPASYMVSPDCACQGAGCPGPWCQHLWALQRVGAAWALQQQ